MSLRNLLKTNAILFVGMGIAFAVYAPPLMGMFGILETGGNSLIYWYVVSFGRLFGAALFGFGFMVWVASRTPLAPAGQRSLQAALLLGNLLLCIVTLVQQVSIWGVLAGWIASVLFLALTAGYAYFLATGKGSLS